VTAPLELAPAELALIDDPGRLLDHAWALEPWGRYRERAATLDALEALLERGGVPAPPPGRDWRLELLAERSIDTGRSRQLEEARALVAQVTQAAQPTHRIALGRAMLGEGQALAWIGTDAATRQSIQAFGQAATHFAALGQRDWHGSALLRCGYSACYQHGDFVRAEALIREALEAYGPDSRRVGGALGSYADVLIDLGEFDAAEQALVRATELAERDGLTKAVFDASWGRARIAAARGDARATERLVQEAERGAVGLDWFETHIGVSFLLDGAEMLDLVGLGDRARLLFQRACERAGEDNDEVLQTAAVLDARSGDPGQALEKLQRLARTDWLEKRVSWRHSLLTAWATFRAGRGGAGELAARGFEQAVACGSIRVAQAGEPDIAAALAPLAERAGSPIARTLLLQGRELVVRLHGSPTVTRADGSVVELPAGMPGELVRLLALHEHGLPVEVVLETFFPGVSPEVARDRLRQVLKRLRAAAGELVLRDGDNLRLIAAWVDVREFLVAAGRVRGARGDAAVRRAYAALALRSGPLLPSDPYAQWAQETREQVRYRQLDLLDLIAADAAARGSHLEALTALEASLEEDPGATDRRAAAAEQLRALGRERAAEFLERGETSRP
jgi:DNA-binding SARP family transcriptional activator